MKSILRAGLRRILGLATIAGLAMPSAFAQTCPIAASCTPGRASSPLASAFGEGIFNVTLNTINNTTLGEADGYKDYACGLPVGTPQISTTLTVGRTYTLSVRTNAGGGAENTHAWLDYNNDGIFDPLSELIMSSNNVQTTHTATFTPPATATLGVPLRLRISSDDFSSGSPIPTPCSTPVYSQVEDYGVTLIANASPPTAVFTTDVTTTCTGCVQFTDASQNVPTSWAWAFGDGQTSTQQSPNHCYTTAGTYNVTLTTTNAAGSATSAAKTITYNTSVPVAASCSPGTTSYFAGYGITHFILNTINNTSADGSAGYQDFTCSQRTHLMAGTAYPITITTGGTNQHDIRIYFDADGNGIFTSTEQIYQSLSTAAAGTTGTLTFPGTALTGQPLRLRIVADFVGANLGACTTRTNGQDEDYTIILDPITQAPTVNFTSDYIPNTCVNPVQFTDQSSNIDAGTIWMWNFGDGQHSASQNPVHQYAASGLYTVSLTVTNAIGSATLTKTNYVTIQVPCVILNYCPSNGVGQGGGPGGGGFQPSPFWTTNVAITAATPDANGTTHAAFSNTSGNSISPMGYTDYTALIATLRIGEQHTMTVVTNSNTFHRTVVWIDTNHDGFFDNTATERVVNYAPANGPGMNSNTAVQTFTLLATDPSVLTGTTRMRVLTVVNGNNATNPCGVNVQNAEVEDYSVDILMGILGTRETDAIPSLTIYPNPTLNGDLHLALGSAAASGAYIATVQNMLGATLLETTLHLSLSVESTLDLSNLAKGVYLLRLVDAQGNIALRRVVRE